MKQKTKVSFRGTTVVRKWVMPYHRICGNSVRKVRGYYRHVKLKVNITFRKKKNETKNNKTKNRSS